MRSLGFRTLAIQLAQLITVLQACFHTTAKSVSQDSWFAPVKDGLGIYINDHDHFYISIAHSTTQVESVIRGYIDIQELFAARVIVSDSLPAPRPEGGEIWSTFVSDTNRGVVLLRTVLEELRGVLGIQYFQACVVAASLHMPSSLRDLLYPVIEEAFECPEGAYLSVDSYAATNAIYLPPYEFEESFAALISPSGFTYLFGESYGRLVIFEFFPSPPNLAQTLSQHNITAVIVIQDDESNRALGSTFVLNDTPIDHLHSSVVAQGAAVMAASGILGPPVEINPLALSMVLHGTLSQVLISRHSILPSTINITLTTTNDNQRTAIIELREGSRPRLNDTLPLMSLVLDGLPAAPAGALNIFLAVTIDYHRSVVMEVFEPISGVREKRVQELNNGYGGDFLDDFILDAERHQDQDEEFRQEMKRRWLDRDGSDSWTVKLAEDTSRSDDL